MFELTHEIAGRDGIVEVRRTALPGPGSLSEQDARDMEAMTVMRGVWLRVVQEQVARHRAARDLETWRDDRARQLRGEGA